MQFVLELCQSQQIPLSGAILDVVKAFNALPRIPLFRAAVHLKLAPGLLRAWWAFLGFMTRHFSIRASLSVGQLSATGFPEGCVLSVVGMMLFDFFLDRWMYCRWPQITLTTYVDNVTIAMGDGGDLPRQLASLEDFVGAFDMQMDAKKTVTWLAPSALCCSS